MRLIDADALNITTITTDDYSGNEVLDVVLKEDIDNAPTVIPEEMKTLIDKTIEILPQLTDAIVENLPTIIDDMDICQECEYRQAARPHGKWIKQENKKTEFFCSECGRVIDTKPFTRTDNFPFCHCGADMRGEKE